jgi:hypothetical protein
MLGTDEVCRTTTLPERRRTASKYNRHGNSQFDRMKNVHSRIPYWTFSGKTTRGHQRSLARMVSPAMIADTARRYSAISENIDLFTFCWFCD